MLLINGQPLPSDFRADEANWKMVTSVLAGLTPANFAVGPIAVVADSLKSLPSGFRTPVEPKELGPLEPNTQNRRNLNEASMQLDMFRNNRVSDADVRALNQRLSHLRREFAQEGDLAALQAACCDSYRLVEKYWQVFYGGNSNMASRELESLRATYMAAERDYEGNRDRNAWYFDQGCVGFVTASGKAGSANVKDCVFGKVTNEAGKIGAFHFDSLNLPGTNAARSDGRSMVRHLDTLSSQGEPMKVSLAGANTRMFYGTIDVQFSDISASKLAHLLDLLNNSPKTYDLTTLDVLKPLGQVPTAIIADQDGLHQGIAGRGEEQGRLRVAATSIQLGQQQGRGNMATEPYIVAFDLDKKPGLLAGVFIRQEAGAITAVTAGLNEIELLGNMDSSQTIREVMRGVELARTTEKANGAATKTIAAKLEKELRKTGLNLDEAGRTHLMANLRGVPKFIGDGVVAELNAPLETHMHAAAKARDTTVLFSVMGPLVGTDLLGYTDDHTPNSTGPNRPPSSRKK